MRALIVATGGALLLAACNGGATGVEEENARIYSAVISAVAAEVADQPLLEEVVFVGGHPDDLTLEVQVGVVQALEDTLTVRFVDDPTEAIDEGLEDRLVRREGILLTVGPINRTADDAATVRTEWYERPGRSGSYQVAVTRDRERWSADLDPPRR